jgi:fatty-acyl-CoA synthase
VSHPRTVAEALRDASVTDRGITVREHDGRAVELPYRALYDTALTIGGALAAHGLHEGDRVALVLQEVNEFVRAFFGIACAGLVPVPLCPPAQAGDVATFARQSQHILQAAQAAAIITSSDVAPLLALDGLSTPPRVLTVNDLLAGPALSAPAATSLDAIGLLQFTSGSTAAPKGVMLSYRNIDANVTAISGPHGLNTTPEDSAVSWLPLYHDMGLIGMLLCPVYVKSNAVLLSPTLFLKRPSAWLDAISKHRATVSFAPNFAYDLCLRRVKPSQIASLDLSSWRIAGCGAEPIRPDTLLAFAEHFAPAGFKASAFLPSYGLAEHVLAVTLGRDGLVVDRVDSERLVRESQAVPADDDTPSVRIVGCGRPFPGHELKIVDDNLKEVPERHVGSIIVRGPSVMRGYFQEATASRRALRDGWLHTGDVGYLADGQLYVCGRTKDMIIRQGRKYHPPDLESAITDARAIAVSGVVVIGINHVEQPDEIVAVIEARASGRTAELEDDVRRRIRETSGLELDRVIVAPPGTIPRTTSGKVRRAETRLRLQAGTLLSAPAEERSRQPILAGTD